MEEHEEVRDEQRFRLNYDASKGTFGSTDSCEPEFFAERAEAESALRESSFQIVQSGVRIDSARLYERKKVEWPYEPVEDFDWRSVVV